MSPLPVKVQVTHAYLIGHNISYSASPAMHGAAYRELSLDWVYELLDVPPERLGETISSLRQPAVAGANVTIPHKLAALELVDELSPEAAAAGSVNTIQREGSRLLGHNTDILALRRALQQLGAPNVQGLRAMVLGSGGSARAAAVALKGAEVTFVARTPAHVPTDSAALAWSDSRWPGLAQQADILINATPLGRHGEQALESEHLPRRGAVIDLVYVRGGTPLIQAARQAGLPHVDGWDLLVWQGAASFHIWTGREAPEAVMRSAITP